MRAPQALILLVCYKSTVVPPKNWSVMRSLLPNVVGHVTRISLQYSVSHTSLLSCRSVLVYIAVHKNTLSLRFRCHLLHLDTVIESATVNRDRVGQTGVNRVRMGQTGVNRDTGLELESWLKLSLLLAPSRRPKPPRAVP